jgi:hypothetical protein
MPKPIPTVSTLAAQRDPNGSMSPDYRWNSAISGVPVNFPSSSKQDFSANIQSGNASDRSIMDDLYTGATTKVWIHTTDWWGLSGHIKNGLTSNSIAQMEAEVAAAADRGVYGITPDWYGRGNTANHTTLNSTYLKLRDACVANGLKFFLSYDAAAYTGFAVPQDEYEADMAYANANYFGSSCYYLDGGRPLFAWFDHSVGDIDYPLARTFADSNGNSKWIFRNPSGADYAYSDGAFGWTSSGMAYINNLITEIKARPSKIMFMLEGPGFNDTLASWGTGRITNQRNGQEWLDRLAAINAAWNSGDQLEHLLIQTWNDYEEGSEVETGVYAGLDTIAVSLALNGDMSWSIPSANADAIAHVIIWSTQDATNITRRYIVVGSSAQTGSVNLNTLGMAAGSYTFYAQAVGRSFFQNGFSSPVSYTITGGGGGAISSGSTTTASVQATKAVWRPETFTNFAQRLRASDKSADEASHALDFSIQTLAAKSNTAEENIANRQPFAGGITRNRPTGVALYYSYFDTTLGKAIWYAGKGKWRDATGAFV